MYLLHTHQPMQVPHPGPSMFLCLCSFPSNSQGFPNSPPTSPGKWDGQGPPRLESAECPSYRTLTSSQPVPSCSLFIRVSWLCLALGGSEGHPPAQHTHTMGGNAASLPQPDRSVQDAGGLTLMGRTLTLQLQSLPSPQTLPAPTLPPPPRHDFTLPSIPSPTGRISFE